MSRAPQSYSFGPLERRGVLGGVRASQATVLAAGMLAAVLVLDRAPSISGAILVIVVVAAALAVAFLPVGGRTLEGWGPVAMAFVARRVRRRHRFRSPAVQAGTVRTPTPGAAAHGPAPIAPDALGDVRIISARRGDRSIGALRERSGKRLTAVLACRVGAFSLLDPEAQARRLARWGLVLSTSGSTAIRRLQWIERTAPAQGDELARWLHAERDPEVPLRGTAMIESYLELISSSTRVAQEHEVLLAIQVDARRVRARGPRRGR